MSKHRHYYYDRITMALDDLLRCRAYCQLMLKLPLGESFSEQRTVYESLFISFVVSYGRVFTTSNTVDKDYKEEVSNDFGNFRVRMLNKQEQEQRNLHERIIAKRDTAVAHSDGISRNYQHYGNTPLPIGRNPYYPYEHEEVQQALDLVNKLIGLVSDEQSRVGPIAFSEPLLGAS